METQAFFENIQEHIQARLLAAESDSKHHRLAILF